MRKRSSLKTKIVGMVLVMIFLFGFGSWWNMNDLADHYTQTRTESFIALSKTGGDRIGAQFHAFYYDVQALAQTDTVQTMNPHKLEKKLNEYVSLYDIYDLILVVDSSGHFIASNARNFSGKNVLGQNLANKNFSAEPWFKATMKKEFTEDKSKGYKGTYVEPWAQDSILQLAFEQDGFGSSFSSLVKDENGNVLGVITCRVSSRWLTEELNKMSDLLKDIKFKANILLLDHKGRLLYGQNESKEPFLHEKFLTKNTLESADLIKKVISKQVGTEEYWSQILNSNALTVFNKIDSPKWIDSIEWHLMFIGHYDEIMEPIISSKNNFYVFFGINIFIVTALGIFFAIFLAKRVDNVTKDLAKNFREIAREADTLSSSANKISETSVEQAAALQETVAAVDQIFAMVEKNSDAAVQSKEFSNKSRKSAENGKEIVGQMLNSISDIDRANNEISLRMDSSNKDLTEITNLIKEIGSKTKVINEIVFQTKLLSFNASVEAARAGEYGKGFAVVAEEVGNLAQMSGNAAKEISSLLDESVKKVETTIDETKNQVERLIKMNRQKVDIGSQIAGQCVSALEDILANVASVDLMVSEIAVASKEQSLGIKEISKAVGQMEHVIQRNTIVAQDSRISSETLREQSVSLENIVNDLQIIVLGESSSAAKSINNPIQEISMNSKKQKVEKAKIEAEVKSKFSGFPNVLPFIRKADKFPSDKTLKTKTALSFDVKVGIGDEKKSDAEFKSRDHIKTEDRLMSKGAKKIAVGEDIVPSADDPGFVE